MLNLFVVFFSIIGLAQNPEQYFGADYCEAKRMSQSNSAAFSRVVTGRQKAEIMAVAFPELIRFSRFQNFFETSALEILYVKQGAKAADFSIGPYQIKPSFAELIENYTDTAKSLQRYKSYLKYKPTNIQQVRSERIKRLSSVNWQIIYLSIFYKILNNKFPELINLSANERVAFMASAYNHGFMHSFDEIKKWQSQKTFPYGTSQQNNPFAYSEVSLYYYKSIINY
jgi:hypothetical protein